MLKINTKTKYTIIFILAVIIIAVAIIITSNVIAVASECKDILFVSSENNTKQDKYNYGDIINYPTVTRDGYTFVCWRIKGTDEIFEPERMPNKNIQVYAVWELNEITIKFSTLLMSPTTEKYISSFLYKDGFPSVITKKYQLDDEVDLSLIFDDYKMKNSFALERAGWIVEDNSNLLNTLAVEYNFKFTVTADMVKTKSSEINFYIDYKELPIKIIFYDGLTGKQLFTRDWYLSKSVYEIAPKKDVPKKDGYTFQGWGAKNTTGDGYTLITDKTFFTMSSIKLYSIYLSYADETIDQAWDRIIGDISEWFNDLFTINISILICIIIGIICLIVLCSAPNVIIKIIAFIGLAICIILPFIL